MYPGPLSTPQPFHSDQRRRRDLAPEDAHPQQQQQQPQRPPGGPASPPPRTTTEPRPIVLHVPTAAGPPEFVLRRTLSRRRDHQGYYTASWRVISAPAELSRVRAVPKASGDFRVVLHDTVQRQITSLQRHLRSEQDEVLHLRRQLSRLHSLYRFMERKVGALARQLTTERGIHQSILLGPAPDERFQFYSSTSPWNPPGDLQDDEGSEERATVVHRDDLGDVSDLSEPSTQPQPQPQPGPSGQPPQPRLPFPVPAPTEGTGGPPPRTFVERPILPMRGPPPRRDPPTTAAPADVSAGFLPEPSRTSPPGPFLSPPRPSPSSGPFPPPAEPPPPYWKDAPAEEERAGRLTPSSAAAPPGPVEPVPRRPLFGSRFEMSEEEEVSLALENIRIPPLPREPDVQMWPPPPLDPSSAVRRPFAPRPAPGLYQQQQQQQRTSLAPGGYVEARGRAQEPPVLREPPALRREEPFSLFDRPRPSSSSRAPPMAPREFAREAGGASERRGPLQYREQPAYSSASTALPAPPASRPTYHVVGRFDGQTENELSAQESDQVEILQVDPSGWVWCCLVESRGIPLSIRQQRTGWIPLSMLDFDSP
ncbi:unnamed protein product [Vitrella brassicaformis CCMP3155]|uniref:SH3 domain-containing protein n=2 Tax=Vitrella brassicaformis TaxID=1169539 RepID=A0A0G4ELD9_VITBC|nr:unnamed protein product [Vitrella brassicaformis CCMP3155]|eukprot:CEL97767.1 unnamed protein product [Vitrella brassicaformis CCMP3155]